MEQIPVAGPWITALEEAYVSEAVRTAWYGNANRFHDLFEAAMATYAERRHAIALPSCTSALHLCLAALGVGPGDEVIVPDMTWIASSAPISYVGAQPVFADVDPDSWCLTADSLAACITPRTRAAIVVDLYGDMPDWDALTEVAAHYGISLIEDAAEAIGSRFRGRPAGSFGVASAFSFHGSKTVTTGEGGMLLTDDDSLYNQCLILRDHGRLPGDTTFFNHTVGFKYRMSSMQAALGLAQIERLEELITFKRELFERYRRKLGRCLAIALNRDHPDVINTYWMVSTIFDRKTGLTKAAAGKFLQDFGISTRPIFSPLSSLPAYRETSAAIEALARNSVAYDLGPRGINLPSGYNMTPGLVDRVCDVVLELVGETAT